MRGRMQLYKGASKGGGRAVARYMAGDEEQLGVYLNHGEAFPLELHVTAVRGVHEGVRISTEQFERLWDGQDVHGNTLKEFRRECETRMIEIPLNDPKDLDVVGVEYADVREAREHARARAIGAVEDYLRGSVVARVKGDDGKYMAVHVDRIMTVAASHPTSRAGDPMYHTHLMLANRVQVGDRWLSIWAKQLLGDYENVRSTYELAMYSDPELVTAMQRHGLSMDGHGQVAELHWTDEATGEMHSAGDVFSKRHEQIMGRYAELLDQWRANASNEHETVYDMDGNVVAAVGYLDRTEPDARTRGALMRQAWADTRPAKTEDNAYARWEDWREELHAAGWNLREMIPPTHHAAARPTINDIRADFTAVDTAALNAVVELEDQHSAWSRRDLEAACRHQVQEWNAVGTTADIDQAVAEVTRQAERLCEHLTDDPRGELPWAKGLTSGHVIETEGDLVEGLAELAAREPENASADEDTHRRIADACRLDDDQRAAMAEITSGAGLTVVEGVAGAGKTTMLKAVAHCMAIEGDGLVIVSPTNRGANVARDEVGADASSVAKLLWDRGWRQDRHGGWRQLRVGERDANGFEWRGRAGGPQLDARTHLVVDEAGMLDQDTALALVHVCRQTGARLTLMGDRSQLPAVGRGGVLDLAIEAAGEHAVTMRLSHRFADPEYTRLMLDLHDRTPETADSLAARITARCLVEPVNDERATAQNIAARYCMGDRDMVIATDTNDQAQSVNEQVQWFREQLGELGPAVRGVHGANGETLHVGDRIMIRENDRRHRLFNRETYTVAGTYRNAAGAQQVRLTDSQGHTRSVPWDALDRRCTLGYASTVYGAQGATARESIYWASSGSDGHSLYTALSRGRGRNSVYIDTDDGETPEQALAAIISRDKGDRGLAHARRDLDRQLDGLSRHSEPEHQPETETEPLYPDPFAGLDNPMNNPPSPMAAPPAGPDPHGPGLY